MPARNSDAPNFTASTVAGLSRIEPAASSWRCDPNAAMSPNSEKHESSSAE